MDRTSSPHGWLDLLGRMAADPIGALDEIAKTPHLASGLWIGFLTVFGQTLTTALPWDLGLVAVFRRFVTVLLTGGLWWFGGAAVLHGLSALFGRRGHLSAFLAVTGWAGVSLWMALAFDLMGNVGAVAAFLAAGPELVFRGLYGLIWWWGLRHLYGWSKGQAFLLLVISLLAYGFLRIMAGLLTGLGSAIGRLFFP